ncbi:MAG: bifunctional [glutamate--ammonia ligase]-adenylyl-L-tyrosine phosphorylase/[glutamate--ammonia-ligase] adenylyltransferase [Pseudomonadales bacterium]|nr:bifunctional [glutamate--ammonia ligase]-adenylyl-L-tyrosine phosphorylase/[glutamate--ammonia-ligase] adenylyltransferase [Pseudomonadales bacterium]
MKPFPPSALAGMPQNIQGLIKRYWQNIQVHEPESIALEALVTDNPELPEMLARVFAASDYAGILCGKNPGLLLNLITSGDLDISYPDWDSHLQKMVLEYEFIKPATWQEGETGLKRFLRKFRQREMLRIIWRDLSGKANLIQTCADISNLADVCINFSLAHLAEWCELEWGSPVDDTGERQSLVVLAMGKYGAQELNLSSDIDLIFAFPENGETRVPENQNGPGKKVRSCTIQAFFIKLGQRLIDVLDTPTEDGFVFRVDMRLRPYGGAGGLALSFGALEEYYQSQGRDWERFAMVKARVVSGSPQAGAELMETLRPFVYRRYLDFATIEALRDMKRLIGQQVRRKGMEQNIKLGRGGIRELEFIVQVLQLIHGGRNKKLQQPSLFAALAVLVEDAYLDAAEGAKLEASYQFLRRLENCLQALADQQTQQLPDEPENCQRIALAMAYENWEQLVMALDGHREQVARQFDEIIREEGRVEHEGEDEDGVLGSLWQGQLEDEVALNALQARGFEEPAVVLEAISTYRSSKQYLALEKTGRERLNRFMAVLLAVAGHTESPDLAFIRVFSFVQAVTRRTAYLVLLLENALALRQLVDLCAASPWIVEYLSKYPVLLDELLKPLSTPPDKNELIADIRQQLLRIPADDFDQQMESLRYFKQAHVLKVAAADIAKTMPLMKISDYLSYIAEVVLEQVLELSWDFLVSRHGYPANAAGEYGTMDFVIIAYGKLGGIELNYGSDLDLVFLHDGHQELATRAGVQQRQLNSTSFYARLGQRIITMLNTFTISGRLYEVDTRLRPSGASGSLVSSLSAFAQYQHENAWTWEHQALVRARPVAGEQNMARQFYEIRWQVLVKARDREKLRQDVVDMRRRMREELGSKPHRSAAVFHLKHDEGGIVDIEFIVQYLVLSAAADCPELLDYPDNMRLLEIAMKHGLLTEEEGIQLQESYIAYRSGLHRQALQNSGSEVSGSSYEKERKAVTAIWSKVFSEEQAGSR